MNLKMNEIFLGLGTNLGDRESNLREALDRIEEFIGPVLLSSSVYETEPWGFKSDNQFLNMVVKIETELAPSGLLGRILMIETLLGRTRGGKQYSSRAIDIDILFFGKIVIDEAGLRIPHPLIPKRNFVLVPLCEIAPEEVHPFFKITFVSLLKKCNDRSKVKLYKKTTSHSNPLSAKL